MSDFFFEVETKFGLGLVKLLILTRLYEKKSTISTKQLCDELHVSRELIDSSLTDLISGQLIAVDAEISSNGLMIYLTGVGFTEIKSIYENLEKVHDKYFLNSQK
ncbi:hypothetical protein [Furfurilactobacillus entadae]|uniref:hypothetical protein n=1 Tax=Furfurilactobacillus entadae TaxID=2922307 RepID=UPI0038B369FE